MRIGLDVMGGDFAPQATLKGAVLALQELEPGDQIVLIGPLKIIGDGLRALGHDPGGFTMVDAPDVIGMGERPIKAIRQKPGSSISVGFTMLKNREIDAFDSAGNSGAMLVGAIYSVGSIPGVLRPCTPAPIPNETGGLNIILDIGTNPDVKPDILYQFAILGSLYAEFVLNIRNPRVGLLNIGEEEEKGNLLCQSAFQLFKGSRDFNFYGNVEGRDIFDNKADVIVCDGFTGNIVVKQVEAMYRLIEKRNMADDFFKRFNYENHGGSPVLGINSNVVIGHGISNGQAIKNMILLSRDMFKARLTSRIKRALHKFIQTS
jgi:glycerol-3-phosphate acyltransferase PlsX